MKHYSYLDGTSGRELFRAPIDAIADCARSGPVDEHVSYWVDRVKWIADDAELRRTLREYGAWDDLDTCDTDTLRKRALWVGAGAMSEQPELYEIGRVGRARLNARTVRL